MKIMVNGVERDATPEEAAQIEVMQAAAGAVDLAGYAAQKRWEKEVGGIAVNGSMVDTSRESQARITGAYNYAQANPSEIIRYKAASGWMTLDAPTMVAIANAVGAHVQHCFAVEAAVAADIANGSITTTEQIDEAFAA